MGGGGLPMIMDTFDLLGTRATASATKNQGQAVEKQMSMAQASQDALVAKEVQAKNDLATAQATASSQASATAANKKRAVARSNTIYTSPLGIGGTADVARKVLLGA
jgi:hypothetical protein